MSLADVETALQGGPYNDYVKRAGEASAAANWEGVFSRVAASASAVAGNARRLGVHVAERASLSDLGYLFAHCRVVTLVAHWRGPEVAAPHLTIDPALLVEIMESDTSPAAALMRAGLPAQWQSSVLSNLDPAHRRSKLAELIDRRLESDPPMIEAPFGHSWYMDPSTLKHFNRAALDAWLPDAISPGNRLELSDGLHSADCVAASIDDDWSGIADLSNCQSAQLIDGVKQDRDDRIVIGNDEETNPISRITLLSIVYDMLAAGGRNYAQTRMALAFAQHDMSSKRRWRS